MNTDATLTGRGRVIVVETKYTPRQFQEHFGTSSVRSEHLYQLFAYLLNLAKRVPVGRSVEGLLLYPRARAGPDFACELHGHPLRVATVNLAQEWTGIRYDLLGLLDEQMRSRDVGRSGS